MIGEAGDQYIQAHENFQKTMGKFLMAQYVRDKAMNKFGQAMKCFFVSSDIRPAGINKHVDTTHDEYHQAQVDFDTSIEDLMKAKKELMKATQKLLESLSEPGQDTQ